MSIDIKPAVAGALAGAIAALVTVFGAVSFGVLPIGPRADAQIRDYLLAHPQILVTMTDKLQQQQEVASDAMRQAAVRKLGLKAFFDPKVAFVVGPANARNTLVEFFDYNCPYCRASLPTLKAFYDAHRGDTRFSFIEFPIKGRDSVAAARAAIAARKQPGKYLDFHFRLMGEKDLVTEDVVFADAEESGLDVAKLKADMADPKIEAAIAIAHSLASAASIDGTPAFIVNGRVREGALDAEALAKLVKAQ